MRRMNSRCDECVSALFSKIGTREPFREFCRKEGEIKEATMTFDPDRRRDFEDPIHRRIADGDNGGWIPALVGVALLLGFAYLIFGNWGPSPNNTNRESSVRMEIPPAQTPRPPN
jgi:hypothetical protein